MKTRRKAYSELTNELAALSKDNLFTGNNIFTKGITSRGSILIPHDNAGSNYIGIGDYGDGSRYGAFLSIDSEDNGNLTLYNAANYSAVIRNSLVANYYTYELPDKPGIFALTSDTITIISKDYVQGGGYTFTADEMTQIVNNFDKTVICIKISSAVVWSYYLYPSSNGNSKIFASSGVPFGQGPMGSYSWRLSISGSAGSAGAGTMTIVESGGGSGTAGVSSIGGSTGAITLGAGLDITGGTLFCTVAGGGSAGVSSIGGKTGAITLSTGLAMSGNQLVNKVKVYTSGNYLCIDTN